MSDNQPKFNEGTDLNEVFHKVKEQVQREQSAAPAENTKFTLTDKQKAAAVFGAVLLGGTAFVAVERSNGQVVEPEETSSDSTQVNSGIDGSSLAHQIGVGETRPVAGGTICPTEDVQIAGNVDDSMSFSEAFSAAREDTGPGGIFSWRGATYNTFFKDEWNQIGLADKQEFLHNAGYKLETPEKVDTADEQTGSDTEVDEPIKSEPAMDWESADVKETMIDGKLCYVFDIDKDGIADAVVKFDEESNETIVLLDGSGDHCLDTYVVLNSNMEPVSTQPLDEHIELAMADLEAFDQNDELITDEMSVDTLDVDAMEVEIEAELEDDEENFEETASLSLDYSNDDNVDDLAS